MLSSLNPTDEDIEELKREVDEDQSGEIEFHEFLEIMNSKTLRWISFKNIIVFTSKSQADADH